MSVLTQEELSLALVGLPDWKLEDGKLVREWTLESFVDAIRFVNQVALVAEVAGHHPDIDVRYNKVRLELVSHDACGVTERDVKLAEKLRSGEG